MNKKYQARDATIAISYACNARCQMCNIWQIKNPHFLTVSDFENLSPDLRYINLSGGETFLHPDLAQIVGQINKSAPRAKIIISSNGLAVDLIEQKMKVIHEIDERVGVRISIDGLEKTHDEIRGIPGIFSAAMETIKRLKKIGVENLGLSFTIMDKNVSELKSVYELSRNLDIELAMAMVQNSDIYFSKSDNKMSYLGEAKKSLDYVIEQELKSWNVKRWARAYYNHGLKVFALEKRRLLASGAGFDSLFIGAEGNVFPSNLINLPMGNIKNNNLADIWQSKQASKVREKIIKENIKESWIICTIRGEMKKHLLSFASWALLSKLKLMLGFKQK